MSATIGTQGGGRTGRVFSLQNHALIEEGFNPEPATAASVPSPAATSLPPIESALEAFVASARQIEAALGGERAANRQLRQENQALRAQLEAEVRRERSAQAKLREELAAVQVENEKLKAEYRRRLAVMNEREENARIAVNRAATASRDVERAQEGRVGGLLSQIEQLRSELHRAQLARVEERKKFELDVELARSKIEHLKQREEALRSQSRFSEVDAQELDKLRREIHHYRSRWADAQNAVRQAAVATRELESARSRFEEARERLQIEEKRREDAEAQLKKERRDKQIALNCLHSAEQRIDQMDRERHEVREAADRRLLDDARGIHIGL